MLQFNKPTALAILVIAMLSRMIHPFMHPRIASFAKSSTSALSISAPTSSSSSALFSTVAEDSETDEAQLDNVQLDPKVVANLQHPFLKTMRDRGYLFQCTGLQQLDDSMMSTTAPLSAYLGFDATADSLHVGSLLQIMILRHLQKSGCRPVVLVGGATSKVGDPTGKDESRKVSEEMSYDERSVEH